MNATLPADWQKSGCVPAIQPDGNVLRKKQAKGETAVSRGKRAYFTRPKTSLFISNMLTCFFPLKTA